MLTWSSGRGRGPAASRAAAQLSDFEATCHEWCWETDTDLVLIHCSPAVEDVLGRPPAAVLGKSMLDWVHPRDAGMARATLLASVAARTGWRDAEVRCVHSSGRTVALQGSAVPVLDRKGRLTGFRGTWRSVTGDAVTRRRLASIAHRVQAVVADADVAVVLQPIVDVTAGELCGLEALARFHDQRTPEDWFLDAHEAGVGADLELVAMRAQLELLADASAVPGGKYLSVNASPALIVDPGFHALLRTPGLALDRLMLEITEHAAVRTYDEIRAVLLPYREQGLRLAVDDTGAGYASFNHVLRLRPDLIKLDRSLLADIDVDPARRAFVTAIVLMALELDAEVAAEGVERRAELEVLRTLGVDAVQGYLLARPSGDRAVWATWHRRDWATHVGTVVDIRTAPTRA